jgi:hypothetical protein
MAGVASYEVTGSVFIYELTSVGAAEVYLPSSSKSRDAWDKDLERFESLPAHPNVTRYLFHEVVKSRYGFQFAPPFATLDQRI